MSIVHMVLKATPHLLPLVVGKVLFRHYRGFKQQKSLAVNSIHF